MNPIPASVSSTDLSLLQERDYTIILARTAKTYPTPPPEAGRRWHEAFQSVLTLVQICEELDPDGIALYVSCRSTDGDCLFRKYDHVSSANLLHVIEENYPPNEVSLELVLPRALNDYFTRKAAGVAKPNGEILLVVLDGEPSDRLAVARSIRQATQQVDRSDELGIGFVQIGQDPIAQGFLQALDDNLEENGAQYDIVHTKILETIYPNCLMEFLLDVLQD